MRHFTASTAIRQDGPLALSTLTGVVSIFRGHSRFRTAAHLHIGLNWSTCASNRSYLCYSRNVDGEKPVGAALVLFVWTIRYCIDDCATVANGEPAHSSLMPDC